MPDNRMDSLNLLDVVKVMEFEIEKINPEMVVTHHAGDVNIDHRVIHEAVITACRPLPGQRVKRVQSFEVPSSTEWQAPGSGTSFQPNCFVDISETIELKVEALETYAQKCVIGPLLLTKAVEHLPGGVVSMVVCG